MLVIPRAPLLVGIAVKEDGLVHIDPFQLLCRYVHHCAYCFPFITYTIYCLQQPDGIGTIINPIVYVGKQAGGK